MHLAQFRVPYAIVQAVGKPVQCKCIVVQHGLKCWFVHGLVVFVALVVASCDGALSEIQRQRGVHACQAIAQAIEQAVLACAGGSNHVNQAQFDGPNSKRSTHLKSPCF